MDRTNLKVVYIDRFKDIDYNLQKERIVLAAKRYNYAKCVIDGTGTGDPVVQDLKRKLFVEDYRIYTNKAKEQLIDKLSIYIEQGMITIPNDEILLDELRRYTYTKKESGMTTYSAPKNRHDDCVIALALCVWGVMAPQTQKETVRRNIIHNEYI
jgi:phage FluMu gp28-like protein